MLSPYCVDALCFGIFFVILLLQKVEKFPSNYYHYYSPFKYIRHAR